MKKKTPIWVPVLAVTLTVVAVIAWPRESPVIAKQKNLQTQTTLSALQQGLERFASEYSKPPEPGASDFTMADDAGRKLVIALLGREQAGAKMQNPRQIPFLNVVVSKNRKKGGLVYHNGDSAVIEGLFDSWGNPFRVILDADDDGVLRFDYRGETVTLKKPAVVISKGPDRIEGTKDDVKSW